MTQKANRRPRPGVNTRDSLARTRAGPEENRCAFLTGKAIAFHLGFNVSTPANDALPRRRTRHRALTPEEHLRRADPVLGWVMDEVVREAGGIGPTLPPDPSSKADPTIPRDAYGMLVRAIVSQNISSFAARSIFRRLTERYSGRLPTPEEILDDDPDELRRAAGLSTAKTASLRSLAAHIASGDLDLARLRELPDEDVIAHLSAVKGIGMWTADMFLMSHLYRPDVLPVGDAELRNTVARAYGLPGPPGPAELERIAEPWRPYRTLGCVYLWQ